MGNLYGEGGIKFDFKNCIKFPHEKSLEDNRQASKSTGLCPARVQRRENVRHSRKTGTRQVRSVGVLIHLPSPPVCPRLPPQACSGLLNSLAMLFTPVSTSAPAFSMILPLHMQNFCAHTSRECLLIQAGHFQYFYLFCRAVIHLICMLIFHNF